MGASVIPISVFGGVPGSCDIPVQVSMQEQQYTNQTLVHHVLYIHAKLTFNIEAGTSLT